MKYANTITLADMPRIDVQRMSDAVRTELVFLVDRGASPLIIEIYRELLDFLEVSLGNRVPGMIGFVNRLYDADQVSTAESVLLGEQQVPNGALEVGGSPLDRSAPDAD